MSSMPDNPQHNLPAKHLPDANALAACHQLLSGTALLLNRALLACPSEEACECLAHLAACREKLAGIVGVVDGGRAPNV